MSRRSIFGRFTRLTGRAAGHPLAFVLAFGIILLWIVTGPLFRFSDTWQLVINTGTTIVTFMLGFLIQHSQNAESAAIHTKLDELIRAHPGAHNAFLRLEELDEAEIERFHAHYDALAAAARAQLQAGESDTGATDIPLTNQKEAS